MSILQQVEGSRSNAAEMCSMQSGYILCGQHFFFVSATKLPTPNTCSQSKACQKSAWKTHKAKCALNQRTDSMPAEKTDALKTLRGFTSKHRPTIAEGGIRAINVLEDPSRAERELLLILVRSRPDSNRLETAYFVTMLSVVPIDTFPQAHEMRGQLKQASDDNKRSGMAGAIFVLLMDTDTGMMNIAPVGFPKASRLKEFLGPLGTTWEEWVMNRLNEGIVV